MFARPVCFSILLLVCAVLAYGQSATTLLEDSDAHYRQREVSGEIDKAIEGYRKLLTSDPHSFEAAWKLSKAYWYLGNHSSDDKQKAAFQNGIDAGKKAIALAPDRCEGHFWLGINDAVYAEHAGMFKALGLVDQVKLEMNKTMAINENCVCGGPQRVLGKLYAKIPWFKGGSKSKSVETLKKSIELCPDDTQSRLFLAQTYLDQGKKDLAAEQLQLILKTDGLPDWIPETKENKIEAEKMLFALSKK